MDSLSIKVLRFIKKTSAPLKAEEIIDKLGQDAADSLDYLEKCGYIKDSDANIF